MSYIVLARKYRPSSFDEVIGQEHITELLKNAVKGKRVAHAYLFSGPRGIGKTSCARILAKSLNCKDGPTITPCGKCPACNEITSGSSFDVIEIDGASNRGIDEIRTIRENVKFSPGFGNFKIYIVDEVHMLTTEAFNALLKTLEEPPPHVKFIFATTDPNKLPATIISRCQRFDFKRISLKQAVESLKVIARKEKIKVDESALYAIAKASQGSFRDSLSVLDQMSSLSSQDIKGEDVYNMLGLVEMDLLFSLCDALAQKNLSDALKSLDEIIDKGKDVKQLSKDLIEHFRNLMVMKVGGKSLGKLLDYPVNLKEMFLTQAQKFSMPEILKAIEVFIENQDMARLTESYRTPLEIAFAKLTYERGQVTSEEPVAQKTPPARQLPTPKVAPVKKTASNLLKSEKGEVRINPQNRVEAFEDESSEEEEQSPVASHKSPSEAVPLHRQATSYQPPDTDLSLNDIKESWNALTFAVSRQKMSLATYLQEGFPVGLKGNELRIGFNDEFSFYKETLESNENRSLLEKVFTETLKFMVVVKFDIVDALKKGSSPEEQTPLVKAALDAFKGKVVNKWHNEK